MDPLVEVVRSIQRNSESALQNLIPSKVSPNATISFFYFLMFQPSN